MDEPINTKIEMSNSASLKMFLFVTLAVVAGNAVWAAIIALLAN